ncbi:MULTISPECIES: AAA family ATPase [Pseudomonas]|uniref:AAA family ATPase n=1 Tax=Pseudomonas weihenstephanensis TaxID=1608994 RepID=A0ABS1ZI56_9PSED|nr:MULTISPECIES: AAA family ATPase [Pseudomonas]MBM1195683.1 AAA family ATPase [Pseudomonas weihenstephanensis]MCM2364304.1 AAA family ATPase [Pseudomonas sp. SR18]
MLEKILLRNVSSYSPDAAVSIAPLKRVSLFYGQNGTGKTTIGNYLQAPSEACYSVCGVEPIKVGREVLVYNHHFMEKNFQEAASQPGVFTLNEGNIEAKEALATAEASIAELTIAHDAEMEKGVNSKKVHDAAYEVLLENVWKPKREFDGTALAYCFKLLNTKERLLEHVRSVPLAASSETAQVLLAEAAALKEFSDQELPGIPQLAFQAQSLEGDPILQEVITGSGDSYLSAFIQQLGNSDWVKHALRYETEAHDKCPLCQQNLPPDFYAEVRKVFDKTYEERLDVLRQLEGRYRSGVEQFLRRCEAPEYQHQAIKLHVSKLQAVLQNNLQALAGKIASPSLVTTLESTVPLTAQLNSVIEAEQQKIDEINGKIKNRKQHEESIKQRFWKWYRGACNAFFVTFDKVEKAQGRVRQAAKDEVQALRNRIQEQQGIVSTSRASITNIDQAVENIKYWLRMLGLKGFTLIREEGAVPQYRLERPGQTEGVFKTLSEGEKTLISFLYFLEVCNGEMGAGGGRLKSDRIIVIDDPISSLSHNYVYDIASLIRRQVLMPKERFKQVIILTHNLFFFHEMVKLLKEDGEKAFALFRITKSEYSSVVAMEEREIQNDYQACWQTIKDALQGRTSPSVMPNMMRNILEYYFSFVHQAPTLRQALMKLSEDKPEFTAFFRYINRESHTDAVNITDFGEIDPATFIDRFKDVFVETNFEAHFDKMMA